MEITDRFEQQMAGGTLYGVGVGPGDPEDMTLKAVRLLEKAEYIAFPGEVKEECSAYRIIFQVIPGLEKKTFIACPVKMTKDEKALRASYMAMADKIEPLLKEGRDVAFITIGDPSIYSTYIYLQEIIKEKGYKACMINGISSFTAAAARLGISLAERSEQLHILPASYDIKETLSLKGTRVYMKAGSCYDRLKELLKEAGLKAALVENCGMEGERVYESLEEVKEAPGYLALAIVSEQ